MLKHLRTVACAPVFPTVLIAGSLVLGFPWIRILLLGLLAAGLTALCALFLSPKEDPAVPTDWNRDLRRLKKILNRIQNRTVCRRGQEILTELKQCRTGLPFLCSSARREITEYYLPTFTKYFSAYATFEECNEGNPSVLATMEQMETSLEQIAENFRKTCDRNDRTAALNLHAETSLLGKKLKIGGRERD